MSAKIPVQKGDTYGRLTIIKEVKQFNGRRMFKCQCFCKKIVDRVSLSQMRTGHTQSCGCYMRERAKDANTKHGFAQRKNRPPEYRVWKGMRQQCNNPKNAKYYRYGARGIKCLWNNFEDFINDMGFRPSPKHSIGRKDNDGHYCKENCEWQTAVQQSNNTSRNRKFMIDGHWFTVSQLAKIKSMKSATLLRRLKYGWSIIDAINIPVLPICRKKIKHNGIELSLKGWSRYLNKSYQALVVRKRHNWSIKAMLETPVKQYKRRSR